jgi:hypothetical protein
MTPETRRMNEDELASMDGMDDIEFLTVCREVRQVAERTPEDELSDEARARLDQVNAEFLKRARITWQQRVS